MDQSTPNDKKIHVLTAGTGEPLVLFHGGMGSCNHWAHNQEELAKHYTVHMPDLPGYGESFTVAKDLDPERYIQHVMDMLLGIVPSGTFRLGGFSFGGIMAAHCAARLGSRVTKLSLMGPGGFRRLGKALDMKKIPRASEGPAVMREVLDYNLRVMMCADPKAVTDEAIDLHHANVRRTRYDGRHFSLTPGLLAKRLREIQCPVQIIWGGKDALCYPDVMPRVDEVRAAMPDIRIDIIENAGHWVQFEAGAEVNRLMLDFLK